jgi:CLIP-associating protein 1/2
MGPSLDPFVDSLFSQLIRMAGFTKKIVAQNTQASVAAIIAHTSCQPKLLGHLVSAAQDKTVATRQYAIAHVSEFIRAHGDRSKAVIESYHGLDQLDKLIRKGLSDANPGVKAKSREAYWLFQSIWPVQAQQISVALDPTALKQLEKAKPANSNITLASTLSTPAPKKPSTSAIIAATRAKARANAAAPPTLRHAATSGASAANRLNTSPVASLGRSSSSRPNLSGTSQRRSLSPALVSPNASSSKAASRSVSASSTLRSPPSSYRTVSTSPSPPSSPTTELAARRKAISPLISTNPKHPLPQVERPIPPPDFTKAHVRVDPARHSISSLHRLQESERLGFPRDSLDLNGAHIDNSLLMAMENPLPPDSDLSDDDAVIEATMRLPPVRQQVSPVPTPPHPQSPPRSQSSIHSLFPSDSASQTANTQVRTFAPHSPTHDVMEDALRANAEQAESSAERLTEMLEPDHPQTSLVPPSLLRNSSSSGKSTPRPALYQPVTPANPQKTKALLAQLALFQNSPAVKQTPNVMDRLYENKAVSGWWLKRKSRELFNCSQRRNN